MKRQKKSKMMIVYHYLYLGKGDSIGVFFLWSKRLVDELKGCRLALLLWV